MHQLTFFPLKSNPQGKVLKMSLPSTGVLGKAIENIENLAQYI